MKTNSTYQTLAVTLSNQKICRTIPIIGIFGKNKKCGPNIIRETFENIE
jgi:hypothetical protein